MAAAQIRRAMTPNPGGTGTGATIVTAFTPLRHPGGSAAIVAGFHRGATAVSGALPQGSGRPGGARPEIPAGPLTWAKSSDIFHLLPLI